MANNVTTEQVDRLQKLYKVSGIAGLLCSDETEWKAIVMLQNLLSYGECCRYTFRLMDEHTTISTATIDQRIRALIKTKE